MLKLSIKSLLAHKLRMLLTTFSIVLGVAFIAGTYIFTDSIGSTFDNLFDDVFSGTDVSVRVAEQEFGQYDDSFDESLLDTVRSTEGVAIAEPEVSGDAYIIDKDGEAINSAAQGPPALGFSWIDNSNLNPLLIKDGNGRAPVTAGEVVIDVNTAENNNFAVGDTVQIQFDGPSEDFEVVGLASFGQADSLAGASISAFEINEAQRVFGYEDRYTQINVVATEGTTPEAAQQNIAAVIPAGLEAITGSQQVQEQQDEINEGLGFINTALLSFGFLAVFVGAYIIYNTFRIIIAQRSKELALLRAIGATQRQVVQMVLYEAVLVGLLSSIIGIFAGIGVSSGIRALGNSVGLGLPTGDLTLEPRTIIVSLIVGITITVLSAIVPAINASRVSPIEALSDNESNKANKSLRKRGILSLLIILVGVGLMLIGLFGNTGRPFFFVGVAGLLLGSLKFIHELKPGGHRIKLWLRVMLTILSLAFIGAVFNLALGEYNNDSLIRVGVGALVMFVGVTVFAPILSVPLANILGWPFRKVQGMPGVIATQNTKRTPRRTASTAAALMIGVSLVVFVSIFASSIKATIDDVLKDSLPADVIVFQEQSGFDSSIPEQLSTDLNALEEIDVVARILYADARIEDDVRIIGAVEPEDFRQTISLDVSENGYEQLTADNGILVRSTLAEEKNWSVGERLTVSLTPTDEKELTIVGTFAKDNDSKILVSRALYDSVANSNGDTVLFANYGADVTDENGKTAVNRVMENYPRLSAQDKGELTKQVEEQVDQMLALFWGLLGFAIFIAVLGIANTLALSVAERTRELGLLRAVGMTKSQMRRMVRTEAIIISLFGALLGIAMGIFFGWAVLKALESEGFTSFVIPYWQLLIYFILSAAAGVFASIFPAYRASKVDVLDAINFE